MRIRDVVGCPLKSGFIVLLVFPRRGRVPRPAGGETPPLHGLTEFAICTVKFKFIKLFYHSDFLHYFLKCKHSFISVTDKIIRCVRHRMFLIEKFCDIKAANIYIKMNVPFFKIRCAGFPYLCIRIKLFNCEPNRLADTFSLCSAFHI